MGYSVLTSRIVLNIRGMNQRGTKSELHSVRDESPQAGRANIPLRRFGQSQGAGLECVVTTTQETTVTTMNELQCAPA
jgi:hypothetical protein